MGTVRYTVINGEVVAEKRNGIRSLYVPDSLGTTRALLDNTQTPTDTFVAWPYGETVHLTGSNPTPFTFVGTQGYHTDNPSRIYVRERVQEPQKARWLTEDPIGELGGLNLFVHASDQPTTQTDPLPANLLVRQLRQLRGHRRVRGTPRATPTTLRTAAPPAVRALIRVRIMRPCCLVLGGI